MNQRAGSKRTLTGLLSFVVSLSMVLSLVPSAAAAEMRDELLGVVGGQSPESSNVLANPDEGSSSTPVVAPSDTGVVPLPVSEDGQQAIVDTNKDEERFSADLADFITSAKIVGGGVADSNGLVVFNEGDACTVEFTFTERADKQFEDSKELVYALPSVFVADADQLASHEALVITYVSDANGERIPVGLDKDCWWITNGEIHVVWHVRDEQFRKPEDIAEELETIRELETIEFKLDVTGSFSTGTNQVDFGKPTTPIFVSVVAPAEPVETQDVNAEQNMIQEQQPQDTQVQTAPEPVVDDKSNDAKVNDDLEATNNSEKSSDAKPANADTDKTTETIEETDTIEPTPTTTQDDEKVSDVSDSSGTEKESEGENEIVLQEPASDEAVESEGSPEDDNSVENNDAAVNESSSDEGAAPEPAVTDEVEPEIEPKSTYVYDDANVHVTATLSNPGSIPNDATLRVVALVAGTQAYEDYLDALNASSGSTYNEDNTLLYDVSFRDANGTEIQPTEGTVSVSFKFKSSQLAAKLDAPATADVEVNHLPIVNGKPVVESVDANVSVLLEAATFTTDGFSAYAFSYTVDFTYDGYAYVLPGNGAVALSTLFAALGISDPVANVASVTFSDPALLSVEKNDVLLKGDWILKSLQSFDTPEKLTVVLKNGTTYVIEVTDPSTSNNLRDFVTNASITGPSGQNADYSLMPGEKYGISLSFGETENLQFPNTGDILTYSLPEGFTYADVGSQADPQKFNIRITDADDTVYILKDNEYWLNNRTLSVQFNADESDTAWQKLKAASNARFSLSFEGEYDGTKTTIEFNSDVIKTVDVDNTSKVTSQKYAQIDLANKKVYYNVTLTSTGHSTKVQVEDNLTSTPENLLVLDYGSFKATSNKRGEITVNPNFSGAGFTWDAGSMSNGEIITLTYTADIDTSKIQYNETTHAPLEANGTNKVKVRSHENPTPVETVINTRIDYSPRIAKDGMVISEDGKTFDCSFTFNGDALVSGANRSMTDTLGDYLTLNDDSITGITVTKYDASGAQVASGNLAWGGSNDNLGSVTKADNNKSFTYRTPAGDVGKNYKYVVTYKAAVTGTDNINTQTTVKNTVKVEDDGESTGTGVITPEPEDELKLYKRVDDIDYTNKEITWTTTIDVPANGLTGATVLVDKLPGGDWYTDEETGEARQLYDTFKKGSVTITNSAGSNSLVGTDSYEVSEEENHQFTISFYKNGVKETPGLTGTGEPYSITVTYKTQIDQDWLKAAMTESWRQNHVNNVELNGAKATATAVVAGTGVDKNYKATGYRTVGDVSLPVYKYEIELHNVTQAYNEIIDEFDTSILEPYGYPPDVWSDDNDSYFAWYTTSQNKGARLDVPVSYVNTDKGMKIITTEETMVRDSSSSTGFYPVTKIIYYLTVKDEAALKKLQSRALANTENPGSYSIGNTVDWEGSIDPAEVTYEYPAIDKKLLSNASELSKDGEDIIARFGITINPSGLTVNNGAPLKVVDTVKNLSVDITSIEISPDPNAENSPTAGMTYDMTGSELTFENVPDGTPISVTYSARVTFDTIGNTGDTINREFSNSVLMGEYSDKVSDIAHRKNVGEGAAEIYSVKLMKYQAGNMSNKLKGAKFALYHSKPSNDTKNPSYVNGYVVDKNNPVTDNNNNNVTFTTDDNGMIEVKGDEAKLGWSIEAGKYYYLEEIEAPSGYKLADFDYAFMVSANGTTDYEKYIFHSGDIMSAKNYPGTDLNIVKEWSLGYVPADNASVVVKLQQRSRDEVGAEWSDIIYRENGQDTFNDGTNPVTLTLNSGNDWKGTFRSLPTVIERDGQDIAVEYQIKETSINGKAADVTVGDARNGSNDEFRWSYNAHGNVRVITNTPNTGSLKLKKTVQVNGASATGAQAALADGTYTFDIRGKEGTSVANISKQVTITFTNGAITEATIDDEPATVDNDGFLTIDGLSLGTYVVSEDVSGIVNGAKLLENNNIELEVKGGSAAIPTASFTNNVETGKLRLTKNVTVNGAAAGTSTAADGDYTFKVAGPDGASGDNYTDSTVVLTIKDGVVSAATVDGKEVTVTGGYVELSGLVTGNYTVTEETPTNRTTIASANPVQVEVVKDQDGTVPATASVTNNIEVGSLKIKKSLTVNGVPAKDTAAAGTDTLADGVYTFQIRKGTNDTTTTPDIRVKINFREGIPAPYVEGDEKPEPADRNQPYMRTGAVYENISERTQEGDTVISHWHDLSVSPDGEVQIDNLEPGDYVVHEVENQMRAGVYLVGGNAQGGNDVELKVTANNATSIPTASFTNNYEENGELSLSKKLISNSPALTNNEKFTFTIEMFTDSERKIPATSVSGTYGDFSFNNGVATVELIGGETKTSQQTLPTGLYYRITEASATNFSLTGITVDGNDQFGDKAATGAITTTKSEVAFENTRDEGHLKVEKRVVSSLPSDQTKSFTFKVILGAALTGTYGGMSFTNGETTFTLKDGESREATNLPATLPYTVTETGEDGFTTSWEGNTSGDDAKIIKGQTQTVTATNTRVPGDLTLDKEVISKLTADQEKEFTFHVSLSDKTVTGVFSDGKNVPMNFTNGEATVTITGNTIAVAEGLPSGITYVITEDEVDGFSLTGKTGDRGTITSTGATATFTNERDDGGLRISKNLITKTNVDKDKYFAFKVTLYTDSARKIQSDVSATFDDMTFDNGVAYVFLKNQESKVATGIPQGTYFTVQEIDAGGVPAGYTLPSGVTLANIARLDNYNTTINDSIIVSADRIYPGQIAAATSVARFTNNHKLGTLTVSKAVLSDNPADQNTEFTFKVEIFTDEARSAIDTSIDGTYGDMTFEKGVATVNVSGSKSVTATGLPVGLYYTVSEPTVAPGFAIQGRTAEQSVQGTIVSGDSKATITNKRIPADLKVSKKLVSSAAADADVEFSFTVTLVGVAINKSYTVVTDGATTTETITFSDGVGTLTLKGGQTKTIKDLPTGVKYTITEDKAEGFSLTGSTGTSDFITEGEPKEAVFTNDRVQGELRISKVLFSDAAADAGKEFTFKIKLDSQATGEFDTYDATGASKGKISFDSNNEATVTLKGGESRAIRGLPSGIKYTVTEDTAEGFKVTGKTGDTGTITTQPSNVEFRNTGETGKLTVNKKLLSELNADKQKNFTFTVTLYKTYDASDASKNEVDKINKTYSGVKFTDGVGTFTLRGGESKTIDGLPYGIYYTVTEASAEGFILNGQATKDGRISTTESKAEFENERDKGGFRFTKRVEGIVNQDQEFTFTVNILGVTLDVNKVYGTYRAQAGATDQEIKFSNNTATIRLKNGGAANFEGLPLGATYTITESNVVGYTASSAADTANPARFGEGTLNDDGSYTVTGTVSKRDGSVYVGPAFVNARNEGNLVVRKVVDSAYAPDTTRDYAFRVELSNKSITTKGNAAYAVVNVSDKLIEFENGVAEFTLKHDEQASIKGLPAGTTYIVTETSIEGITTTWTDTVTNVRATGSTGQGTIMSGQTSTTTATNKRQQGVLNVTKTVVSHTPADLTHDYEFMVDFYTDENYSVQATALSGTYKIGSGDAKEYTRGHAAFSLKSGETANFGELPLGLYYKVSEVKLTGDFAQMVVVTSKGSVKDANGNTIDTGKITSDSSSSYYNTRTEGGLYVFKTVDSSLEADRTKQFNFTVTLYTDKDCTKLATNVNGMYGTGGLAMTFTNGVSTFALRNGELAYAMNLPDGLYFKVMEDDNVDFTAGVTGTGVTKVTEAAAPGDPTATPPVPATPDRTGGKGQIDNGSNKEVYFTNARKGGNLKIEKVKESEQDSDTSTFNFVVELYDKNISGTFGDMTFNNGVANVTLAKGQSATATGLPVGMRYQVTEVHADNYYTTWSNTTWANDPKSEDGTTYNYQINQKWKLDEDASIPLWGLVDGEETKTITWTEGSETATKTFTNKSYGYVKDGDTVYVNSWVNDDASTEWGWKKDGASDDSEFLINAITPDKTDVVSFTNTPVTAPLAIAKRVDSTIASGKEQIFHFEVQLLEPVTPGVYGQMYFGEDGYAYRVVNGSEKGERGFDIKAGEVVIADNLPKGTHYVVSETPDRLYEQSPFNVTGVVGFGLSGEQELISDIAWKPTMGAVDERATAEYTNTRERGELEVYKTVESDVDADKDKAYSFTITIKDETYHEVFCPLKYDEEYYDWVIDPEKAVEFTNGVATIELHDGEYAHFYAEDPFARGYQHMDGEISYVACSERHANQGDYELDASRSFPRGVGYTVEENTDPESGLKVTMTGNTGTINETVSVARFTNTRESGNLTVSKSVISEAAVDKDQIFNFTVRLFSDEACTKPLELNTRYGDMLFDKGVAPVAIKGGQTATATGLPTGVYYTVTEAEAKGFKITGVTVNEKAQADTSAPAKGVLSTDPSTVAFENTRDLGRLGVEKKVVSDATLDKEQGFVFTVRLNDTTISRKYPTTSNDDKALTFNGGVATVTLKDGEKATAEGLPSGVTYSVSEQRANDYTVTSEPANTSATIAANAKNMVFTNTRNLGGIKLVKTINNMGEKDKWPTDQEFEFNVALFQDAALSKPQTFAGETTYGDLTFNKDGVATVKLSASNDWTAETGQTLPIGLYYKVTEIISDSQKSDYQFNTSTGEVGRVSSTISTATFDNERLYRGGLLVKKTVANPIEDDKDQDFGIRVTLYTDFNKTTKADVTGTFDVVNENDKSITFTNGVSDIITLKSGEQASASGLPTGLAYVVAEEVAGTFRPTVTYFLDGAQIVPANAVIANDVLASAEVTNRRELTERSIRKDWDQTANAGHEVQVPESLNVALKRNGEVYRTATLNATNQWTAKFENLPVRDYDGNPYTYEWDEISVPANWTAAAPVTDATDKNLTIITNTRDTGSIKVTKHLENIALGDLTADEQKAISFTVTDASGNVVATNTLDLFAVAAGDTDPSWTIGGLPTGDYTVTETYGNTATTGERSIATTYSVNGGKTSVKKGETAPVTITNTYTGSLIISKSVTVDGAEDAGTEADGTYAFEVKDAAGAVVARPTITVKDGKTSTEKVDGLKPGTYTVTEVAPTNGVYLIGRNGVQVEVSANAEARVQTVSFKNNKPGTPDFEKKIKDKNDSTGETSGWQDSADYDIGDEVPYKLTATLSNDVTTYRKYHITFTDKMEPSLDFNEGSVEVYLNDTKLTEGYTLTPVDEHSFTVRLDWGDGENLIADENLNGAKVDVYFTATLNEQAKLGKEGNVNASKLSYSNNPNSEDDSDEGELPWDYVIAFTYKVDVNKFDKNGDKLEGAEFTLEKYAANLGEVTDADVAAARMTTIRGAIEKAYAGATAPSADDVTKAINDALEAQAGAFLPVDGKSGLSEDKNVFTAKGLDDGVYRLTETKVPTGYNAIDPVYFVVDAKHETVWDYTSEGEDVDFDVEGAEGRFEILTSLTGSTETGSVRFTREDGLQGLTGDAVDGQTVLRVRKMVKSGSAADKTEKQFHFMVTLNADPAINGTYGEMTFTNNVSERFALRHGEEKVATGLPAGVSYTVVEEEANEDDFVTTSTGDNGTLSLDEEKVAVFTNAKKPGFEKKIQDTNDTTGETSGWQDSADYDIGDKVPYRLTATLSGNVTDYKSYHVTFTDQMEESLDYNKDAEVTVRGNDGKVISPDSYKVERVAENAHDFKIKLTWEGKEGARIADESINGATAEVLFTATLNDKAKLGKEGNVNACKLAYSNSPSSKDDSEEEELPWDYVIAFTYRVDVNKVDQNSKALAGAEFKLEKFEAIPENVTKAQGENATKAQGKNDDETAEATQTGTEDTSAKENLQLQAMADESAATQPGDTTEPNVTTEPNDATAPNDTTEPDDSTTPKDTTESNDTAASNDDTTTANDDSTTPKDDTNENQPSGEVKPVVSNLSQAIRSAIQKFFAAGSGDTGTIEAAINGALGITTGKFAEVKRSQNGQGDAKNMFVATGIDDGLYRLSETKAPEGYDKIDDVYFFVVAGHAEIWNYSSDPTAAPAFSPESRLMVLESLSGDTASGVVTFSASSRDDLTGTVTDKKEGETQLKVTKTVRSSYFEDMVAEFGFTVTLSDKAISGKYGDMEFKDGVATFKLKSGESKSATGLPEGTGYTVTEAEANAAGFATTSTGATGKLELGKTATAAFVNSRPSEGYGRLSVHKTVLSNDAYDRSRLFNFRVQLSDPTVNGVYGDMMFTFGTATFTLAGGQTRTAVGLPLGVAYTVSEAEANSGGFTTTAMGATGVVTPAGSTAAFTNSRNDYNRRRASVTLNARKNLTGRALRSGEFSFALREGSRTLQTKANDASGNVSFDTIEYAAPGTYTYTIEEVRGSDPTVTYDTHAAKVTVRVTEDSTGNLSASATYDSSSPATFNNTATEVTPTPAPTPATPTPATPAVTPATPATVVGTTTLPSRLAITADPTSALPALALVAAGSSAALAGLARRRRRRK